MKSDESAPPDRRRQKRVPLALRGRYMLANGREYPCITVDVSPAGFSIKGVRPGLLGERVVAYIEDLGRLEGVIVRRKIGWFAVDMRAPQNKTERLAQRIAWLLQRGLEKAPSRRSRDRMDMSNEHTILRTVDGKEFMAELVDLSIAGAALSVDVTLPIGARVSLGDQPAYVVRRFAGGLAVKFDPKAAAPHGEDAELEPV